MMNSHTTTTTTTTTPQGTQPQHVFIRYNGLYVRTVPGILKVLCMVNKILINKLITYLKYIIV